MYGDNMSHEIDLSKYQIRTDLAIESLKEDKISKTTKHFENVKVTEIYIDKEKAKIINKKIGNYITIEFEDITDYTNQEKVKEIFSQQLKKLINRMNICDNDSVLVVGLGNNKSTPDSLGPESINKLIITNHLYELGNIQEGFRRVSAINPGVMGETGIETSDIIKGIIDKTKPDFIIVIDALASSSIERVNHTIQITDTGIHPGSGIGNSRKEISKEILNIPVIAIGIPTTVDAVTIVSDTIDYMTKHFTYTRENLNQPINKLIIGSNNKYIKSTKNINKYDKKKLLGLLGNLNHQETRQLIYEVLTPIGYNFMVTPKEIDFIILKLSEIIGNGINKALHNNINNL